MVKSREGAHRCSGDGAWRSCVGGRSRGRNTSEPAVSLAQAVAWCFAVCVADIKGPNRYCADNRVADVAGSDRSGVYDWSAVADLRSCGCPDCIGGHPGFGGLRAAGIVPSGRRGAELAQPPVAFEWRLRCGRSDYGSSTSEYGGRGRTAFDQVPQGVGVDGVINRIVDG